MKDSRYSRQIIYSRIGEEGQRKLSDASVAVMGLGALGTVSANNLARAGVGRIRLIDRDYVELSNLQRQTLYDEEDVEKETPKAIAAYEHLIRVNSSIRIEPVIADVNSSNIEELIGGCDLVLDCTDNFEIRLLLNEACDQYKIPWIYSGAIGSSCMTMNILPGITPCFQCFAGDNAATAGGETCSTAGVLNMITNIASSIQTAEAVKILVGSEEVRKTLLFMDVWDNSFEYISIEKNPQCPVCGGHHYRYLGKSAGSHTVSLCGRNEIQVIPANRKEIRFEAVANHLTRLGTVSYNDFMFKFHDGNIGIRLFRDGRAIIENAKDANNAKSIYSEYIGF